MTRKPFAVDVVGALVLAGATVAAWWLWLGWDASTQVDPVTQVETGPYDTPQIAGCVLTVAVLAIVGGLLIRPWLVVVFMTAALSVSWWIAVATEDDSGLWVIGLALVVGATAVGTAVLSFGAALLGRRRRLTATPR